MLRHSHRQLVSATGPVPPAAQVGPRYGHANPAISALDQSAVAPTWNGGTITLTIPDLSQAFPENVSDFRWQQLFATPQGLEYLTNHISRLSDATTAIATFTPTNPGIYRFRLIAADPEGVSTQHEVDVLVTQKSSMHLEVKGRYVERRFDGRG